jgi:purine-binding chemotaxis protein CheW
MVDLAKIRKKAKEKKEGEAKAPAGAASPAIPPPEPARPAPKPAPEPVAPAQPSAAAPASAISPEPAAAVPPPSASQPSGAPAAPHAGAEDRAGAKLERFRETAGRISAGAARQAGADAVPAEALLELLTFVIAGEQYAIDIERIAEIISPREATPVPNAPRPVVGIISLRGTIVTMLDIRRELGHGVAAAIGPETRTIVVDDKGSLAGFTVDRVLRVVKVRPEQIQPHPVVSPAEQSDAVRGVFQTGTSLTIVLEVERLLARG